MLIYYFPREKYLMKKLVDKATQIVTKLLSTFSEVRISFSLALDSQLLHLNRPLFLPSTELLLRSREVGTFTLPATALLS